VARGRPQSRPTADGTAEPRALARAVVRRSGCRLARVAQNPVNPPPSAMIVCPVT
jgi:hypothetical protein